MRLSTTIIQVTVTSVMGLGGAAQMADYSASKAALFSLNESLRYELDKQYVPSSISYAAVVYFPSMLATKHLRSARQ